MISAPVVTTGRSSRRYMISVVRVEACPTRRAELARCPAVPDPGFGADAFEHLPDVGRVQRGAVVGDYLDAVDRLPADNRLGLNGPIQATPWDEALGTTMTAADVAVHKELRVDMLLSDLR